MVAASSQSSIVEAAGARSLVVPARAGPHCSDMLSSCKCSSQPCSCVYFGVFFGVSFGVAFDVAFDVFSASPRLLSFVRDVRMRAKRNLSGSQIETPSLAHAHIWPAPGPNRSRRPYLWQR
ncbi:hypothetical protein CC78DRAFT_528493 [Lojkania enalia]|uniref:Uncharacterized protein n=1 Tax=Lojkania enalia TaxID=147567 RepID=A0A9P4NCL5_9PLEO|nr:hypothetical protein CC78DRAFT_528493 [Didymosphaeria enalia]